MKKIIAYAFGYRERKLLNLLFNRLSIFNVPFWCTDGFNVYDVYP
ncbi:IS1 family transposase [Candidatus Enterovibrio escicola]